MNALVPQAAVQLPAHLQQFAATRVNDKVGAIAMPQPPSISLFQAKFWLVDAQGTMAQVMAPFLDVVVVDMNKAVSKIFYQGAYDPTDTAPPTCFSDNGRGASSRSAQPQHTSCEMCPQNAWGSKVSQMSGKPIKACTDVKKLAVILAAPVQTWANGVQGAVNAAQQLYMLRVPAASLKAFGAYMDSLNKHGVDASWVVTRLQFDATAGYPSLLFSSTGFISQELAGAVYPFTQADKADERRQLTGENDVPWQGGGLQGAAVGVAVQPVALPAPPPQQPAQFAPQPQPQPPTFGTATTQGAPTPPFAAPPVTAPPMPTAPAPQAAPAGTAAPSPSGRGRGRPRNQAPATQTQQAPAATAAPFQPSAAVTPQPAAPVAPAPSPPPQQQVVMNPAPPPADLGALLAASLGTPPASPQ